MTQEKRPGRALRFMSALIWGALACFFGVGTSLVGIQALPSPGGVLALVVGIAIIALAFILHRLTCRAAGLLFRPHT